MASDINPNTIDATYPVAGQDNATQGFRDNFSAIKTNFGFAEDEITELQSKVLLKTALGSNGAPDNNMAGAMIYDVQLKDISFPKVDVSGTSGSIELNFSSGQYQIIASTTGSVSLDFSSTGWPPAGRYANLLVEINISNTAHTLTLPTQVDVNALGIIGYNAGTRVMTFPTTGKYEFEFSTSNAGASITVKQVNQKLTPFNNSSEDLDDGAAANLAVTTSYFSTAAAETATLAAGVEGQIKTFAMYADTGDMVITVTNAGWKSSGTGTVTFDTIGQACTLQYINSKWFCIGNNGAAFA